MQHITPENITDAVSRLVRDANRYLPPDLVKAISEARGRETSRTAEFVLDILLENARTASETGLPVCQDTGIDVVFIEAGRKICLDFNLEEAINQGIEKGTSEGLLRASVCDPLTRRNSGTNTPAICHVSLIPGDELKISVLPKGCGSENMSAIRMLPPSAGTEGIINAVVEQVKAAGPNPCPPGIIGVGIGGTMEHAALISKKALLRPVATRHEREDISAIEQEIEKRLSNTGLGPMGLGGSTTTLAVHADASPCHIASLPVAINVQCHAARYAIAVWRQGKWHFGENAEKYQDADISEIRTADIPVKPKKITLPMSRETAKELRAGQWVLLSGPLFTGRDQTHKKLVELLEARKPLPADLQGQIIYYVGPSPAPEGRATGSAGPTTSYRMDAYTPQILNQGVVGVMGKGKRSEGVRKAICKHGAVYLATIGGAGAYLSDRIKKCSVEAFPELGPEALFRMEVENFPAIVINDSQGNDHYGQPPLK